MAEKLKSLFSNFYIRLIMILIPVFCFDSFVLQPFLKDHYLEQDLRNFKDNSWKYILITFAIIIVVAAIFARVRKISEFIAVCFISGAIILGFKSIFTRIFLFINTETEHSRMIQTYEIINHKEPQVLWLDAGEKKSIHDHNEIELIDKKRKSLGLQSISQHKTNDTVHVIYKKGIFNVNYID